METSGGLSRLSSCQMSNICLTCTLFLLSSAEVAALLLYAKSLGFQDKPDYQRLRQMLSTGAKEKLDFSVPRGVGERSMSKGLDPPTRGKVRTSSQVSCTAIQWYKNSCPEAHKDLISDYVLTVTH